MFAHSTTVLVSSLITFIQQHKDKESKESWNAKLIISLGLIIYSGLIVILMVVGLSHQTYLISNNITTNECIRSRLPETTFDQGCAKNWSEIWNA